MNNPLSSFGRNVDQAAKPKKATRSTGRLASFGTLTALALTTFSVLVPTSFAAGMSAPIRTTAYVNVRPGPSTTSGNPLAVMPPGTSPNFHCWALGQNINGVNVWFNVTYGSVTGYYASYYDNSSYATDGQISSKYGIPQCGSNPPPPATSQAQTAANWARAQVGRNFDSGLCLTFASQAWTAAGVNIRPLVTVPISSNTYPIDIWRHFKSGTTGGGTPPVGALVFFASKSGNRDYSHVVVSIGGGQVVSTTDSLNESVVHVETMAQRSYSIYLGWWLP